MHLQNVAATILVIHFPPVGYLLGHQLIFPLKIWAMHLTTPKVPKSFCGVMFQQGQALFYFTIQRKETTGKYKLNRLAIVSLHHRLEYFLEIVRILFLMPYLGKHNFIPPIITVRKASHNIGQPSFLLVCVFCSSDWILGFL